MMASGAKRGLVVAILGAESTGKSVLARDLASALGGPFTTGEETAQGAAASAVVVDEWLRDFCLVRGRTPREDEQQGIAAEQTRRIEAAAVAHDVVIADTTSLMVAVYSDIVFGDTSLYAQAQAEHRRCDITLLTALDLPWKEDGLQRDGPHVREPVDALVRASLRAAGIPFAVIGGAGVARLEAALAAVRAALRSRVGPPEASGPTTNLADQPQDRRRWAAVCERCGDPDCELHLLRLGA